MTVYRPAYGRSERLDGGHGQQFAGSGPRAVGCSTYFLVMVSCTTYVMSIQ